MIDIVNLRFTFNPSLGSFVCYDANGKSYLTEIHNIEFLSWIYDNESINGFSGTYTIYLKDDTIIVL